MLVGSLDLFEVRSTKKAAALVERLVAFGDIGETCHRVGNWHVILLRRRGALPRGFCIIGHHSGGVRPRPA